MRWGSGRFLRHLVQHYMPKDTPGLTARELHRLVSAGWVSKSPLSPDAVRHACQDLFAAGYLMRLSAAGQPPRYRRTSLVWRG